MDPKKIVTTALLVFVFGSLAYLAVKESRLWTAPDPVAAQDRKLTAAVSTPAPAIQKSQTNKVIAYYFHTNYRCATCRRIEAYSKEAIDFGFSRELKDGRLEWRLVNYEQPENQHFAQDYQFFTKSLVLVRIKDGKEVEWTNLKRVWELTGEYDAFLRYVQQEVRSYLEKD